MTKFSKIWDTEVKMLAKACVKEPELVRLMSQSEDYEPSKEEKEYLQSISGKYKDTYGMYYISNMIGKVEEQHKKLFLNLYEQFKNKNLYIKSTKQRWICPT